MYHFFPGGKEQLGAEVIEVASTNEVLRDATARTFAAWIESGLERFVVSGISSAKARELSIAVIALLEGAFGLSRAARTTEAVEVAGASAVALVRAAMTQRDGS